MKIKIIKYDCLTDVVSTQRTFYANEEIEGFSIVLCTYFVFQNVRFYFFLIKYIVKNVSFNFILLHFYTHKTEKYESFADN